MKKLTYTKKDIFKLYNDVPYKLIPRELLTEKQQEVYNKAIKIVAQAIEVYEKETGRNTI